MPTALELTPEGWKDYLKVKRHKAVPAPLTSVEQKAREALLDCIRRAASEVKARFGARRVILFGSLSHGDWFISDSDVDIAVEGLRGDEYWRAWRLFEEIVGDRPVDLIEIEAAGESLRRAIMRYGVEL